MSDLTARRVTLAVAAVLTTAIGAGAEPGPAPAGAVKRAFAVADFYRLRPVLEPVISPDGRTIVYTVTSRDLEHAKQTIHLWRVDAAGTRSRRPGFPAASASSSSRRTAAASWPPPTSIRNAARTPPATRRGTTH